MTARRPRVSAEKRKMVKNLNEWCANGFLPKYPHKCDEQIMPKSDAPPKIPVLLVVKFKSHFATGIKNITPLVSITTAYRIIPQRKMIT